MTIRVRFAPSPTGYLHVGGARTALYNWLFARHSGGKFILRIEDTDRARSTEDAIRGIIQSMSWLGLDWDENLSRQTERLDVYAAKAAQLVEEGKAYYCYCTPEELKERRGASRLPGGAHGYDRRCRHLSVEEEAAHRADDRWPAIRLNSSDEGSTIIEDLVRGRVEFDNAELDDLIIMRPDGVPTYNFASVVDDIEMEITHVIRGEDHLPNTPRQSQIYTALGAAPPTFAHLSMILGPDKAPLSKRHGATSIEAFRDEGYLPEALINFLALLGWSWDDRTTLFSIEELIEKFTLDDVGKSPAVFDTQKLEWLNGHYIRELSTVELVKRLLYFWRGAGLLPEAEVDTETHARLVEIASICQERLVKLSDIVELTDFFFQPVRIDQEAAEKVLRKDGVAEMLNAARAKLETVEVWSRERIEQGLRDLAEELDEKPRKVFQPIRVAVSGRKVSPPLFESLEILGKEESLDRMAAAAEMIT